MSHGCAKKRPAYRRRLVAIAGVGVGVVVAGLLSKPIGSDWFVTIGSLVASTALIAECWVVYDG